jgi:hypothetical protein
MYAFVLQTQDLVLSLGNDHLFICDLRLFLLIERLQTEFYGESQIRDNL